MSTVNRVSAMSNRVVEAKVCVAEMTNSTEQQHRDLKAALWATVAAACLIPLIAS